MKHRVKALSLLLAGIMTLSLLAGCGGKPSTDTPAPAPDAGAPADTEQPSGSDKLVIYSPATEGQINAIIPLFEEKTGIEVEVITGGTGVGNAAPCKVSRHSSPKYAPETLFSLSAWPGSARRQSRQRRFSWGRCRLCAYILFCKSIL